MIESDDRQRIEGGKDCLVDSNTFELRIDAPSMALRGVNKEGKLEARQRS